MPQMTERMGQISMARGLRFVLIAQAVVAGLLLLTDLGGRWQINRTSDSPAPAVPVSPGDQVREYESRPALPRRLTPSGPGDRAFPADMPSRLEFTLGQDPVLGEHLLLNGGIASGDAARLEAYLDSLDSTLPIVALNSPGGDVREALEIGRLLRDRQANTTILAEMACMSACPYVLASGIERQVSASGLVGLHQHYYDAPGYMPVYFAVENIQRGQGETMAYLIEMGVDPGVMVYGLATPPEDIYILVEAELLDSQLATEIIE